VRNAVRVQALLKRDNMIGKRWGTGKRLGKVELNGTKMLLDGTDLRVTRQLQGNN
jgi:hypothetical protein